MGKKCWSSGQEPTFGREPLHLKQLIWVLVDRRMSHRTSPARPVRPLSCSFTGCPIASREYCPSRAGTPFCRQIRRGISETVPVKRALRGLYRRALALTCNLIAA
jgi:hypothetical protein